jgi:hypothetical protein
MAKKNAWDLNDHRRFAQQFLPPGEFRDGYLDHLDDLELKEPPPEAGEPGVNAAPAPAAREGDRPGWPVQRYVVAAVGSVAFAYGTWVLTSLL